MDDKTAAEPFTPRATTGAVAAAPRGRRRRAVAAGGLLLAVAATLSACGGSSGKPVAGGSPSPVASSPAAPSAPAGSGLPSASAPIAPAPGTPTTAPGGTAPGTGTAPTRPAAPVNTPPAPGSGSAPGLPSHLQPTGYLSSGNQLTVFFFGGVCDKYGLRTDESKAGKVGVQIVITQKAPVGQACPALVKSQAVVATLAAPLQGRAVVDLDTGANVPLESLPNGGPVSASN
ncbi:hypothetical protein P3T36_005802 [Kitasatospora sp. MAP12-15]|uniref:hypothetical protein n=1 Tax=unclassified Kitasatospora TaxID=2633591 RepID=UPI0024760AD0|nr:hypothetical protein [Kitasatospora sp. MAP12-44]MDH6110076.1 hypothetical protein [Kitasatospora sp. MAP12-44]